MIFTEKKLVVQAIKIYLYLLSFHAERIYLHRVKYFGV